jgi:hypothetical protein
MGLTPQDKSDERRKLGVLPSKFNKRATDEALLSLSSFVGSSANSESTMALGIFETESEKVIMIALQEGAEVNEDILKGLRSTYPEYKAYDIVEASVSPAPGLHAEMMIVRELLLRGLLNLLDVNSSARLIGLRIVCPEKMVCPDCAGYLRKHGIPHYPVDCGKASPNWVNPRTGACFRAAGKKVGFYYKLDPKRGDKVSGNPVDANAGNLGPLGRVGGYKSAKRRTTAG